MSTLRPQTLLNCLEILKQCILLPGFLPLQMLYPDAGGKVFLPTRQLNPALKLLTVSPRISPDWVRLPPVFLFLHTCTHTRAPSASYLYSYHASHCIVFTLKHFLAPLTERTKTHCDLGGPHVGSYCISVAWMHEIQTLILRCSSLYVRKGVTKKYAIWGSPYVLEGGWGSLKGHEIPSPWLHHLFMR